MQSYVKNVYTHNWENIKNEAANGQKHIFLVLSNKSAVSSLLKAISLVTFVL